MYWFIALGVIMLAVFACVGLKLSGFHLLAYNGNISNANSIDLTANVDGEFSQRNGHYLFSENYNLLAGGIVGQNVTETNILSPTLNAITKFNLNPANTGADTAPSPFLLDYYTHTPIPLPLNEELQFQVNGSGNDTVGGVGLLVIGTVGWKRGVIPTGISPLPVFKMKFTCNVTMNLRNWSTLALMTFEQSLRGGTYAVCGMEAWGTNLLAGRIVFPQSPMYNGRRLRPGFVAQNAYGAQTAVVGDIGPLFLGTWGQFTTAELPFFEGLGTGSATTAVTGYLVLVRLSESIQVNYANSP
jgi:hypothetical protein